MTQAIQVPQGIPFWTQRVTLEGRDFYLRAEWNQRDSRWYLGMSDAKEVVIYQPRKVVADWDLLRVIVDRRRPPGFLFARDMTGQGLPPGLDDFGTRVLLLYYTRAEMLALANA